MNWNQIPNTPAKTILSSMSTYTIHLEGNLLKIGFREPADNPQIVRDAHAQLEALSHLEPLGGELLKINGPASIPVAFVIAHKVAHLYGAIAVFDPKLGHKYVIVITHTPKYKLGDLID
jgi:CRISPR-associated protein Csx3